MFNKRPLQNTSTVNWKLVLKQSACACCWLVKFYSLCINISNTAARPTANEFKLRAKYNLVVCLCVSECVCGGVQEWDLRKRIRHLPLVINTAAVTWAFALWFIPFRATGLAVWQRQLHDFPLDLDMVNPLALRGHFCISIVTDS